MPIEPLPDDPERLPTVEHEVVATTTPISTAAKDSEIALKTEGQRKVSDMWETTQRQIAISVTLTALLVAGWLAVAVSAPNENASARTFLFGVANLVIGFYFGRTNHQKVGGVGGDANTEGR